MQGLTRKSRPLRVILPPSFLCVEPHRYPCRTTQKNVWYHTPKSCGSLYSLALPALVDSPRDQRRAPLKLLIVEDSASVRRLIKSMVAGLAVEITECSDGAEALAAYTCHRPDFVLMDIQTGLVDGITATARIRAADPAARIIMVTDYDQPDLREAAAKAGACAYVVKENLLELVPLLQTHP